MYKILIHVGLSKTATTSLQNNVLMPLHKEGLINFLPRSLYTDYRYKLERTEFEKLLDKDKLNVISEEIITETDKDNNETLIETLSQLVSEYDSQVLISLRSPVDMVYSYYVQTYGSFMQSPTISTVQRFANQLMKTPDQYMFKMFFFSEIIPYVENKLGKSTILLYEDLIHDKDGYFETLSEVLNVNKHKLSGMFLVSKENVKRTSSLGKYSQPLRLTQVLHLQTIKNEYKAAYWILKSLLIIELIRSIDKKLWPKIVTKGRLIPYLSDEEKQQLKRVLTRDNDILFEKYGLNRDVLAKYGYLNEES